MATSITRIATSSCVLAPLILFAIAAPAPQDAGSPPLVGGLNPDSSCLDLENYQSANQISLQSDFWDGTDASSALQNWCNSDAGCQSNFASAYATPWGLGQSFSCELTTPCKRPDCSSLQDPGAPGSGSAYEVMVSLSNLNQYFVNLKSALTLGQNRWAGLQVALENDFWPHPKDQTLQYILTTFKTIAGILSAYGSNNVKAGNQAFAGLMDILSRALTQSDKTLDDLAKMETATDAWYKSVLDNIDNWNDDLMTTGHHDDVAVQDLMVDGTWLDYRNIPILNTDNTKPRITPTQLNDYMFHMMMADVVNNAWKPQGVYIVRKPMSQEDFDGRDWAHDPAHKLYYNGMGYFIGRVYLKCDGIGCLPTGEAPPGWETLAGHFDNTFDTHGVIMSSADGFDQGGYDFDFNSKFDGVMAGTDTEDYLADGPRAGGAFSIPVCEPPSDMSLDDFDGYIRTGGYFEYGVASSALCLCLNGFADKNGSPFTDHFPQDVQDRMDPNCNPDSVLIPGPIRRD